MRATISALVSVCAILGLARTTSAQDARQAQPAASQAKPPAPQKPRLPPPRGLRVFVAAEAELPSARDTFSAVMESPVFPAYGGGVEIVNLWRGVFVRFQITRGEAEAERGLVINGAFIPTGVPFDIGMRNVEIGAGWRFNARRPGRSAHLGVGITSRSYRERTAGFPDEDVNESHRGEFVLAGFTFPITSRVLVTPEGYFRRIDAGEGTGIMAEFGERDLGGAGVRLLVNFRVK